MGCGTFAILLGMGLGILGMQPEIYHRDAEWYFSHYCLGMLTAMLMIFSLTIVQDIYRDQSQRWRNAHIVLNSIEPSSCHLNYSLPYHCHN
jgi:hypothetical protein